jgi:ankyrin repeat protein
MQYIYHNNYCILQDGCAALMKAGNNGHLQLCELLLNRGADIDHTDKVCDVYYIIQ